MMHALSEVPCRTAPSTYRTFGRRHLMLVITLLVGTACKRSTAEAPLSKGSAAPAVESQPASPSGYHFRGIALRTSTAAAEQQLIRDGFSRDFVAEQEMQVTNEREEGEALVFNGLLSGYSARVMLRHRDTQIIQISVRYQGKAPPEILYTLNQKYGTPSGVIGGDEVARAVGALMGLNMQGFAWCSSGGALDKAERCPLFDDSIEFVAIDGENGHSESVIIKAGQQRPPLDRNY